MAFLTIFLSWGATIVGGILAYKYISVLIEPTVSIILPIYKTYNALQLQRRPDIIEIELNNKQDNSKLNDVESARQVSEVSFENSVNFWAMYWIVFSIFKLITVITDKVLNRMPFYSTIKFGIVLSLQFPLNIDGSLRPITVIIYTNLIQPFFTRYKESIDSFINSKQLLLLTNLSSITSVIANSTAITSFFKSKI